MAGKEFLESVDRVFDNAGNMTWYAKQKGYEWLILKNSYRDGFRKNNNLWKEHILDVGRISHHTFINGRYVLRYPQSEQCWIDDKPIFFHHGRGGYRRLEDLKNEWILKVEEYFKIKKS